MARLIPHVAVEEISLKPERDVARKLVDQLPNNVLVYHSYPWLRADRNDRTGKVTLHEGEADFLILWPEMGLLVLEVKGGTIGYESDCRRWFRKLDGGREKDIQDPFEQARKNMYEVVDKIKDRLYGGKNPNFSFGYAVVFPDCTYSGSMPPGGDPAIILSSGDLNQTEEKVAKSLRQWSRTSPPRVIDSETLNKVKRVILPEFNILPVLFRTIEEQEEKLFRLTEDQARLLHALSENPRAAIKGVAGSGKTLLAKAQAQRFADEGKSTLLLCYNKALANWLRDSIPDEYRDLIIVYHFHGLAREWSKKAGIQFSPLAKNAEQFWRNEAADLLFEAIEILGDGFDAVVIDEAQDFFPDWWTPVELINKAGENGNLYVFYDPVQNLYNEKGVAIPAIGTQFTLPTNCRNTQRIAKTCGDIISSPIATRSDAPLGVDTDYHHNSDPESIAKQVGLWIKEIVKHGKVSTSQVAILSPFKKENSSLAYKDQFSTIPLVESLQAWKSDEGVLFSTIRSFKGLEADVVILIDLVKPGSVDMFSSSDFYVACSRAKHVLKVISKVPVDQLFVSDQENQSSKVVE